MESGRGHPAGLRLIESEHDTLCLGKGRGPTIDKSNPIDKSLSPSGRSSPKVLQVLPRRAEYIVLTRGVSPFRVFTPLDENTVQGRKGNAKVGAKVHCTDTSVGNQKVSRGRLQHPFRSGARRLSIRPDATRRSARAGFFPGFWFRLWFHHPCRATETAAK
ncbi:uncharacterized protein BDW47DRAFT_53445 [Aspergillus candidus]|uniref:Uncharacterized protein n=1 Tax=Aspergillus candidus TaxID=41067 RepID=A0A2I2F693_ASPCN|nr:hypothetical protein BDW47DRAFT_53445 [Aspergillus candidus]PLB36159.1 hypothetical protein BDW47DRAFT_53445 [Aspergillus candidus]